MLAFDKLLVAKGGAGFASNWGGPNTLGNAIVDGLAACGPTARRPRSTRAASATWICTGTASGCCSPTAAPSGRSTSTAAACGACRPRIRRSRTTTPATCPTAGSCCVSNACEQAVPCTGGADVGNLHLLDADGTQRTPRHLRPGPQLEPGGDERRPRAVHAAGSTPTLPHYFTRLLFRMNPDGTGQMEYYGSNSYWPNAMYWPRPIPGHPTMVVVRRLGASRRVARRASWCCWTRPAGGTRPTACVQRMPGYGKKVEPIIQDKLVVDSWPQVRRAVSAGRAGHEPRRRQVLPGRACSDDERSTWDLCLVDIFDNITPILTGGYMTPIPLQPRPQAAGHPVARRPDSATDAMVYLADVYQGTGLQGYPRGSIKRLRIGTHHYRYAGNGDTLASSLRRRLGREADPGHGAGRAKTARPCSACRPTRRSSSSRWTPRARPSSRCAAGTRPCRARSPPASAATSGRTTGRRAKYTAAATAQAVGDRALVRADARLQLRPRGAAGARPPLRRLPQRPAVPGSATSRSPRSTCGPSGCTPDYKGDYSPAYMALQRYVRRRRLRGRLPPAGAGRIRSRHQRAGADAEEGPLQRPADRRGMGAAVHLDRLQRPLSGQLAREPPAADATSRSSAGAQVQEAVRQHRRPRRGAAAAAADRRVRAAASPRAAPGRPRRRCRALAARRRPRPRRCRQAAGPGREGTGPGRRRDDEVPA